MTTRDKFKHRIIELIHGLPYEEAIKKELIVGSESNILVPINNEVFASINAKLIYINNIYGEKFPVYEFKTGQKDIVFVYPLKREYSTNEDFSYFIDDFTKESLRNKIVNIIGLPITIGRVMQAVEKGCELIIDNLHIEVGWELTKENGEEATDDDQSDETIEALLEIIK